MSIVGRPALAAAPDSEADKARIERLEATVAELSRRLNERDQKDVTREEEIARLQAEAREQAAREQALRQQVAAAPPVAALPARTKSPSNNHLEVYGFAEFDGIQDFKRVNPAWDATLRPSRIPTDKGQFGSNGQTIFSVRQTRFGAKANGEILGKPYEAKFEFDLFGTGVDEGQTTFRIRHAYAKWGPILAGQTNTLFMDGDLIPNVVDYWGPPGLVFVRNPQVRLTFVDNDKWMAAVAIEHPSDDIDPGSIRLIDPELATNIKGDEKLPDLTMQFQYRAPWGHLTLAGIARRVGYDTAGTPDNRPHGSKFGWGINGGAVVKVSPATLKLAAVYGHGIATYMNDGGMDLAPSAALIPAPAIFPAPANPPLHELLSGKAVPLLGVSAYVDMQWAKRWSSSFGYSFTKVDNTNFQEPDAFHKGEYASGNLLWTPVDRLTTGFELLWGRRTDNDGNTGVDLRTQFTFKISFSSNEIWGD
jgi:hypothetical protein